MHGVVTPFLSSQLYPLIIWPSRELVNHMPAQFKGMYPTTRVIISGILELIEPGDSDMADKGFDISYELFVHGCKLTIPPFVRGGHLSKTEVTKTRKIAPLRIHVERTIANNIIFLSYCSVIP